MDGRIVDNNHGFSGDRLAKKIKTPDHNIGRNTALHAKRGEAIIGVEKSQNIEALAFGSRHFYRFTYRLPGIGNTRVQRKSSFVKVIQVKRSGLMFFLTL